MPRVSEKEVLDIVSKLEVEVANTPFGKNTERIVLAKEIIKELKNAIIYPTKKEKKGKK